MKKSSFIVLGILTFAIATVGFGEMTDERELKWSCAANNVQGSGPYWGYGDTEEQARTEALRVCADESKFHCWPVPDSCSQVEAE